jgi:hypothetical protein
MLILSSKASHAMDGSVEQRCIGSAYGRSIMLPSGADLRIPAWISACNQHDQIIVGSGPDLVRTLDRDRRSLSPLLWQLFALVAAKSLIGSTLCSPDSQARLDC